MKRLSIGIFGAGALGCLVGGYLSREHTVMLYGRASPMEAVAKEGLQVSGVLGEVLFHPTAVSQLQEQHFDLAILGVKTYATNEILQDLERQKVTFDYVASLQNGLKDEILFERFGVERVLGCVVYEAVNSVAPGHIYHSNQESSYFGTFGSEENRKKMDLAHILSETLSEDGLRAGTSENMRTLTWYKWMSCAPRFAVMGALDYDAVKAFTDPDAQILLLEGFAESRKVAKAEGIIVREHPLLPELFLKSEADRKQALCDIGQRLRASGQSPVASLVQDLRLGKTMTEADEVIGRMLDLGKRHKLEMPVMGSCYARIKGREQDNTSGQFR